MVNKIKESSGSKSDLEYMHGLVTKFLTCRLEMALNTDDDKEPVYISPAEIQMVLKFLKDNDITCDISDNAELAKLRDTFDEFKHPRRMPSVGVDENGLPN